jgi:uncharacterized RDD family membrane protein YckC
MTQPPAPPPPPAAPPQAPPVAGPSGPRATFGRRLGAYLLDVLIISVVSFILIAIGAAISDTAAVIAYLVVVVGSAAYFIYFEGGPTGQTIGKRALGIRVIDYNTGGPLGYGRGFIRWIARLVSSLLCYLGYLWMLWDREKQTWHDKLASTVVVPESAYPVSGGQG